MTSGEPSARRTTGRYTIGGREYFDDPEGARPFPIPSTTHGSRVAMEMASVLLRLLPRVTVPWEPLTTTGRASDVRLFLFTRPLYCC